MTKYKKKKKNQVGVLRPPDFKTYKATIIVWKQFLKKGTRKEKTDQCYRRPRCKHTNTVD